MNFLMLAHPMFDTTATIDLLISDRTGRQFAQGQFRSLGEHTLRGVGTILSYFQLKIECIIFSIWFVLQNNFNFNFY